MNTRVPLNTDQVNLPAMPGTNVPGWVRWDNVLDKPETYPPSPHTHPLTDVLGLGNFAEFQTEFDKI
ncbi:MAG: hypothetical protein LBK60_06340 [Verrucomicrobiales bacterium]|jgi:hypothetical protein|nr:hypothetical protein [Verrucomicrobiales bacterium]